MKIIYALYKSYFKFYEMADARANEEVKMIMTDNKF
jgi:hypothetical protein